MRFDRDYFDLHGEAPPEDFVTVTAAGQTTTVVLGRERPRPTTLSTWVAGLWLFGMGLFWTIVLGGAAIAAVILLVIFAVAAFTP